MSRQSRSGKSQSARSIPSVRPTGWRATLGVLRRGNVRLYLVGMLFSGTGVWLQRIAQDWLVLELTDSPTQVGITVTLQFMPMLLFGLIGGLAADRYAKRRILICTQSAMMLCSTALAVLTLTGVVQVWHIYIVAFLVGSVFAFDIPTRQAMVNELVDPEQLRTAIGTTATVFQIGALVGPAISGLLIHAVGPGMSFAVTAGLYLVPMAALARMRIPVHAAAHPPGDHSTGPVTQLREGVRYVAQRPAMRAVLILVGTYGIFISNLPVTNAAFARSVFESGPSGYGLLNALVGCGAMLGAFYAATRSLVPRRRAPMMAGLLLATLYLAAAAMPGFYGFAVVLVAIGALTVTLMTLCNTVIQMSAELHVRGRVMGLFNLIFIGSGAAGGPVIGAMVEYAGPRSGLILGGVLPVVVTVVVAFWLVRTSGLRVRVRLRHRSDGVLAVTPIELPTISPTALGVDAGRCDCGCRDVPEPKRSG